MKAGLCPGGWKKGCGSEAAFVPTANGRGAGVKGDMRDICVGSRGADGGREGGGAVKAGACGVLRLDVVVLVAPSKALTVGPHVNPVNPLAAPGAGLAAAGPGVASRKKLMPGDDVSKSGARVEPLPSAELWKKAENAYGLEVTVSVISSAASARTGSTVSPCVAGCSTSGSRSTPSE